MSTFRETFTKQDKKENLLDYDDSAFLYFAASLVLVVAIPWTYFLVRGLLRIPKDARSWKVGSKSKRSTLFRFCKCFHCVKTATTSRASSHFLKRLLSPSRIIQGAIIGFIWYSLYLISLRLSTEKTIQSFDPFEILGIAYGAADREIKKAYRTMSLKYHPDKNQHDPLAASKFLLISKAHQALTDDIAKANWEKYGNPDGPGTMKVGIGLPRFLLEEEHHLLILCSFFILLLFVVPLSFMCYYQRQKKYAPNNVRIETLHFLSTYMTEGTRAKNFPEFLAASAESRDLQLRPTDNVDMKQIVLEVVEPKKRQFSQATIVRNYFLILAHIQRLQHTLSPALKADLDTLLQSSMRITASMIEIATLREWTHTATAAVEFRRCLVQAIDLKASSLLQIPHFDEDTLKHCNRGKGAVKELREYIQQAADERKGITGMDEHKLADVEAFCAHVSDVSIKAEVIVQDEEEIVEGDVASVVVTLTRGNLREGEAQGPVHAPSFPSVKYEEWYIFLSDKGTGNFISYTHGTSCERVLEETLQFQVPVKRGTGDMTVIVHAMSDSYAGLDQTVEVPYKVLAEKESQRRVYTHPEDEALDNEPTLFQQFMGTAGEAGESEDEEGDEGGGCKNKSRRKHSDVESVTDSEAEDD